MNVYNMIQIGDKYYLDLVKEALVKEGLVISLSRIQFRLLYILAKNMGQPVSSRDLIEYAWGSEEFLDKNDLHVYISRIRRRLENNHRQSNFLLSLRGVGYILYYIKDGKEKPRISP